MKLAYEDIILDQGAGRAFKWFVAISLFLHILAFYVFVIVIPNLHLNDREFDVEYTSVTLVSAPSSGLAMPSPPPADEGATVSAPIPDEAAVPTPPPIESTPPPEPEPIAEPIPEPAPPEPEPIAEPIPEPTLPPPPIPEPEPEPAPAPEPEPAPAPEPEPAPQPAPRPQPRPNNDAQINDAIADVEARLAAREADAQLEERIAALAGQQQAGEGSTPGVNSVGSQSVIDAAMRDYLTIVYRVIRSNWRPPSSSLIDENSDITAVYVIHLNTAGTVVKSEFRRESGEQHFDLSVENAIERSRFQPLPAEFDDDMLELVLTFDVSGLRNR